MNEDWMRPEDWQDLVLRRLEQARETLGAARLMAEADHWRACVNRLYYACFYAVEALLASEQRSARTHKGARVLFNEHFVKLDRFPSDLAGFFNKLFEKRMESDYEAFADVDHEEVREWLPQAEAFVEAVAARIDAPASDV